MDRSDEEDVVEHLTITYTRKVPRGMQGLNSPKNPWNEPLPQDSRLKTFILNVTASLVASAIWLAGGVVIGVMIGMIM